MQSSAVVPRVNHLGHQSRPCFRLRVVSFFPPEDRRESQDSGGRAHENWDEDKKAREGGVLTPSFRALSHRHLGFLDVRSRRSPGGKKETTRSLDLFQVRRDKICSPEQTENFISPS